MTKRPSPLRGQSLFRDHASVPQQRGPAHTAHIDGAARGNPGPASYGVVIRDPSGAVVATLRKYIGHGTNNVAEYYGLIAALDYAQSKGIRALRVESDSELLVKQIRGQYKVKSADLRPLFERAKRMSQGFDFFRIEHVFRERNREADALANQALDESSSAGENRPQYFQGKELSAGDLNAEQEYKIRPRSIRARVRNGALVPAEPLDLAEGDEVEITIQRKKR